MKLNHLFRSKFIKANATLGLPTLVRLFAGVAKSKTSALLLGTTGVGVVGIGAQIQSFGVTCATMGTSSNFVRVLSQSIASGDVRSKQDMLGTSFTIQLLTNLPILVLGAFFAEPLSEYAFGQRVDTAYLIPILVTIPIQSIMTAHVWGVFYAHGRLGDLARASVAAALIEAAAYIGLVRWFGIVGAFWGLTLGMAAWFVILVALAARLEKLRDVFRISLRKDYAWDLVHTGAVMTLAGGATYAANALIRIRINRTLGGPATGTYQVVMALTAYYLPYFTNGVWGRLFPKISASGLDAEGKYEWSEALVLTSVLSAGVQMALMVAAGPLVSLFYSRDFSGAVPLTPLQFLGDQFYLISIPCLGVLMGLGRLRLYAAIWIAYYALFYGLATWLTTRDGLQGTVSGYLGANLALAAVCLGCYARYVGRSPNRLPTLLAMLASAGAVVLQSLVCLHGSALAAKLCMPLAWSGVCAAVLFSPRIRRQLRIHAPATEGNAA